MWRRGYLITSCSVRSPRRSTSGYNDRETHCASRARVPGGLRAVERDYARGLPGHEREPRSCQPGGPARTDSDHAGCPANHAEYPGDPDGSPARCPGEQSSGPYGRDTEPPARQGEPGSCWLGGPGEDYASHGAYPGTSAYRLEHPRQGPTVP